MDVNIAGNHIHDSLYHPSGVQWNREKNSYFVLLIVSFPKTDAEVQCNEKTLLWVIGHNGYRNR